MAPLTLWLDARRRKSSRRANIRKFAYLIVPLDGHWNLPYVDPCGGNPIKRYSSRSAGYTTVGE